MLVTWCCVNDIDPEVHEVGGGGTALAMNASSVSLVCCGSSTSQELQQSMVTSVVHRDMKA